ncbi:hypothetical protein UlMin_004444 [Ulmus minor]
MSNYPSSNTIYYPSNTGNENDRFDDFANSANKEFSSATRWAVAGSVVSGLVVTIAIVAIVYAIIDCLKKLGNAVPAYAKITTSDSSSEKAVKQPHSSNDFPVISNSQVEFATMERFLSDMAREKPMRFSPQQLESSTDNYSTILGSGGFGVVFKGVFPNGVQAAVKVLSNNWDKRVEEQFMAEVGTLGRTYHINLVRLYGFCFDPAMRALVYEFMDNGSLDKFLFSESREVEWEKLHDIALQTAKGIAYLHEECERKIIHYDIKPGNVLLDRNLNPKVADFGLAKLCNRDNSQTGLMADGRGTPGYAAPEMWKPYPVTHKCDVYSFGILLFEIVGRRRHFDDSLRDSQQWLPRWSWEMYATNELAIMVSFCGIEEKNREKAERALKVALLCIQHSPEARPLMSNVVQMLEGNKEISPPPCPFENRHSPQNLNMYSGTDDSSNTSTSPTKASGHSEFHCAHNTFEIDLAVE